MSQIELSLEDVVELLEMLVYDNQLEKRGTPEKIVYWPATGNQENMMATNWSEIPCATCPVMDKCGSSGLITPEKCVYFTDWLKVD